MASSLRTSTNTSRTPVQVQGNKKTFLDNVNHTLNCISIVSVFAVHFLLVVAVIIAEEGRGGSVNLISYYNGFFFLALFLAVYEHLKPGPLQLATVANLISIVFDVLLLLGDSLNSGGAQFFLILNIVFRPLTSIVLLRKSYQRKRRLQLHGSEAASLGTAIKNLLYNANSGSGADLEVGKDLPLPTVLSTLPAR